MPKDPNPQMVKDLDERSRQLTEAVEEYRIQVARLKVAIRKLEKATGIVRQLVGENGEV